MKYYIQRELNEYGPYTLADLQRYVAQGSILPTDLTRSEGMTEWVPVSQVIGNIPIPAPIQPGYAPGTPAYGGGTVYAGETNLYGAQGAMPVTTTGPVPPDFHWALVLLVSFFCGFFQIVWLFIEAGFVKKLDREDKSLAFLIGGMVTSIVAFIVFFTAAASAGANRQEPPTVALVSFLLIALGGAVLHLIGIFQMRSSIENYYNTIEPINLRLSGVMTFFFAVYYFQYHFTRIANWKKTGYLPPQ
jgi:hypothetical protein